MGTGPVPSIEITELFARGKNRVEIALLDICGGAVAGSILWMVNVG